MATFTTIKETDDCVTVVVEFAGQAFEQVVVAGTDLQAYADQYEVDWLALQLPEPAAAEPGDGES